jgi:hypothetical protein
MCLRLSYNSFINAIYFTRAIELELDWRHRTMRLGQGVNVIRAISAAVIMLSLGMHASRGALAAEEYKLYVLSSRPDSVSGKDVLVELIAPAAKSSVRVMLNGQEVTAVFRPAVDPSRLVGLVGDLQLGRNTVEARIGSDAVAKLDIVDHPLAGPIFSGPHQTPFACQTDRNGLGKAQDSDCSAQTAITYYYKQRMGALVNIPDHLKGFSAPPSRAPPTLRRPRHLTARLLTILSGRKSAPSIALSTIFNFFTSPGHHCPLHGPRLPLGGTGALYIFSEEAVSRGTVKQH